MLSTVPPGYNSGAISRQAVAGMGQPGAQGLPGQYSSSYAAPSSYSTPSSVPVPNPYYSKPAQHPMVKALMGRGR